MKRIKKLVVLSLVVSMIMGFEACNNSPNNSVVRNMEDITERFTGKAISKSDSLIVVRTNEELLALCEDAPTLNFNEGTLLISSNATTYGVHSIGVELQQNSSTQYILVVDVTLNMTAVAERWRKFYWITPKIDSTQSIRLIVNAHH